MSETIRKRSSRITFILSVLLLTKYKICTGLPRNIMAGYEKDELHCCHPGTLVFYVWNNQKTFTQENLYYGSFSLGAPWWLLTLGPPYGVRYWWYLGEAVKIILLSLQTLYHAFGCIRNLAMGSTLQTLYHVFGCFRTWQWHKHILWLRSDHSC